AGSVRAQPRLRAPPRRGHAPPHVHRNQSTLAVRPRERVGGLRAVPAASPPRPQLSSFLCFGGVYALPPGGLEHFRLRGASASRPTARAPAGSFSNRT